jgi:hypothetical protein
LDLFAAKIVHVRVPYRNLFGGSLIQNLEIEEGRYAFAWHQNIILSAWWETASAESLTRLQRSHRDFVASVSGPLISFSILYITRPKAASKEERRLIGEIWAHHKERFAEMFFFVKAGGLFTASLRLLLSGVQLLSNATTPIRIYNDLPESISVLASSAKIEAASLTQTIQLLSRSKPPKT